MSSINMYEYEYYATNFTNWSSEINLKDVTHGKKDCQCRKMSLSENAEKCQRPNSLWEQ